MAGGLLAVATTKAEGLARVRELVSAFAANEAYYKSAEFDETSARVQFIDPLFEALGWDVADRATLGSRREVALENRQRYQATTAGLDEWDEDLSAEELAERQFTTSVPDYVFRIDLTPKFVAEAKRPSVSLRARVPTFQAKTYAWNMELPVAVLTDFEELRVFDGRWTPEYDRPDAAVISGLDLRHTEYADNWDRIWDLLSREAVMGGSLERFAREQPARGAQSMDRSFLGDLVAWRRRVAVDLRQRNPDLNGWELAEATQRILDRVVFIRVMEDRGILSEMLLRPYARRSDAWHRLVPRIRELDAVYNGQLFAEHFCERLSLSDGVFQRLIESLYPPYSAYRFDVVPPALLGSVYERFLGQEIGIDEDGEVVIENKPEVRHAGGVYYTPRWVVDRLVEEVVAPLVEGKTPRAVANIKIVDPACGSGAFLLGAFEYLVAWHERYYDEHPDENPERHFTTAAGERRLTADAKAEILSNNLFGVDIDAQAVEVSQLSLYLAVLEHENDASLRAQRRLIQTAYLPRLDRNIRWGNSLVAPDDLPDALFDDELARRINPFDWRDPVLGFGEVFEKRGGFDAVLSNPPYTRVQVLRQYRPEETEAYVAKYRTAGAGSFDIAFPFIERGLEMLRPDGQLGFIVSRQFTETDAGRPLRELLSSGGHVRSVVDFGDGLVFEDVSAYTLLLVASRTRARQYQLTRVPPPPDAEALATVSDPDSPLTAKVSARNLTADGWTLDLPAEHELLERLEKATRPLEQVCGGVIYQGVITGADYVFRLTDAGEDPEYPGLRKVVRRNTDDEGWVEEELLRPVYSGRSDIRRFHTAEPTDVVLLPYTRDDQAATFRLLRRAELRQQYPEAWSWLTWFKEELEERSGEWTNDNWWGYSRRQNLERFEEPKILVPYMVDELAAHLDNGRSFFVNVSTGGYGIPAANLEDPEYICALLNSRLLSWALRRRSRTFRGGWFAARKGNLAGLPIVEPPASGRAAVVDAYQRCVEARAAIEDAEGRGADLAQRRLVAATATFDTLVEDLYGLDDDERALIRT